jgi:hypothetical protein
MDPFSMFMLTTGPAFLKKDESIINAVVRNSYLLPRFMEDKEMDILLQGGTEIRDIIYLQEDSDAEFYASDKQDFNYRNQQVGTQWTVPWRFLKNSTSWTDHEIGLNESGSLSDQIGRFHRFKRIQKLKFMNLWTTQIHKMEDSLVATPHNEQMEAGSGILPNSLGVFIQDRAPGLAGYGLPNQGASAAAWTTVQQVNVGTFPKWNNQRSTFASGTGSILVPENFWAGMRELHSKCKFERLPRFGSYSDPSRTPSFYAVSLWGLISAEVAMRSEQDAYLAGRQDPAWPAPMFSGVPFVYISSLNGAILWSDPATTTVISNEAGTAGVPAAPTGATFFAGPRIIAVNGKVVNMVMHRDRVIYRVPPFSPDRQPFLKVMVTDTWMNNACQNRRELGVMTPSNDQLVPAAPSAGV